MAASPELARQTVHIAAGGFAFALAVLSWPQAVLAALTALAFNAFVLPRIAPGILRAADRSQPWRSGIVIYPAAVLALILVFRSRLDLAAAAWAILAAGDGAATLAGVWAGGPALPWNPRKTVAGLAAFVVAGAAAAYAALVVTGSGVEPGWWMLSLALVATLVAAFVETAPIGLDDNVSVPAAAAAVLWSLQFVEPAVLAAAWPTVVDRAPMALAANAVVALAGWAARTVTVPGAVTGIVIGTAIAIGGGWAGWTLLLLAFVTASVMTRAGYRRKAAHGIAEARGGRRGPANAIANTGVAAWAALAGLGLVEPAAAWLALTAALVTGASDTVASEVGKAWGRHTRLVIGFQRVPTGTSGAVSAEGTAAGVIAAAGLAAAAWALGLISTPAIAVVTVAATVASLVEGALGATLESSGILDNDALNLINTLVGAGLALAMLPLL